MLQSRALVCVDRIQCKECNNNDDIHRLCVSLRTDIESKYSTDDVLCAVCDTIGHINRQDTCRVVRPD